MAGATWRSAHLVPDSRDSMTIDRLRALYAVFLAAGRRPRGAARLSIDSILALAERHGGIMNRLRTLDTVMSDRESIAELEILHAAAG